MKRSRSTEPRLSPRQLAFARYYSTGITATDAAIKAGYSAKSARAQAFGLSHHPLIVAELERLGQALQAECMHDALAAFNEAGRIMEAAMAAKQYQAAKGASELRAKLAGHMVDRQQIEVSSVDIAAALAEAKARVARVYVPIEHDEPAMLPSPAATDAERGARIPERFAEPTGRG